LVGWASLTASSWSSDFKIWVTCSWRTVLATRAISHYGGACWTDAYSVFQALLREARLCDSSFTASSVRNNSFSGSTFASTVYVSLDSVAVGSHGGNASYSVCDDCLSWWASALASCASVLGWETAYSLELAPGTAVCLHETCWACADASYEGLSGEASWACCVASWLPLSFDLPWWAFALSICTQSLVGEASLLLLLTSWFVWNDLVAGAASALSTHSSLSSQASQLSHTAKTSCCNSLTWRARTDSVG